MPTTIRSEDGMVLYTVLRTYTSFDAWAMAIGDEAEMYREWLGYKGDHCGYRAVERFIPGVGTHGPLPGGYLAASVHLRSNDMYVVYVHDRDDGNAEREYDNEADALAMLDRLVGMGRIFMQELYDEPFNFQSY